MCAAVPDVREAEPGDAKDAVDVRVQDGLLVLGGRLPERDAAEREPGIVEQDVDPAELGDAPSTKAGSTTSSVTSSASATSASTRSTPPGAADDPHAGLAEPELSRRRSPRTHR